MTMFTSLLTAALLASTTLAQTLSRTAIVTIQRSRGGAGNGLTNTTITIPIGEPYTGDELEAVSSLYVTGGTGVPLSSISCQAFQDADAQVLGGNAFTSVRPALLSTNTVQVGSILCTAGYIMQAPGVGGNYSTSILATSTSNLSSTSSSARPRTSTYLTTVSPEGGEATQSTVTSIYVPAESTAEPTDGGDSSEGASATPSSSASASAGLSAENVGSARAWGAEIYGAAAVALMGLAYVL